MDYMRDANEMNSFRIWLELAEIMCLPRKKKKKKTFHIKC